MWEILTLIVNLMFADVPSAKLPVGLVTCTHEAHTNRLNNRL